MLTNRLYRFFVVSLLAVAMAPAQEITGSITGTVSDNSGAVIPEATIVAVNLDTAAEARAVTDAGGNFLLPVLRAGRYRVTVERTGFQRYLIDDVRVNTSERARVDVVLTVGAVSETVSVTASAPLLQSEQATIGHVVEGQTITSIPLATRNFTQILGTSAGVVGAIMNADNRGTGSDSVSVNGARRGSNNLLVDGVPTTNQLNNAPDGDGTPSIEFLSEFKVLTSLYSAEFGRNSGSVINVTTRSGTNAFHGTVYEFLRNTKFNARPYFFPQRRPNNQNQFGANVGGRILKDRTFFFAGWESSRQRNGNGGGARFRARTPTDEQRQGIFPVTLFDPQAGSPFPNNTIPVSRINPVSKKISDTFFPRPNLFDGSGSNFEAFQNEPTDLNQYTVRIDHRFGDKDTINGRWFESFQKDLAPFGKGLVGFGNFANREKHTWGVTHTHLFSPTFVLEARGSGDYTDQFTFGQNRTDPASMGLQPIPGVTFAGEAAGMPRIQIVNYIQFGNDQHWSDFIDRYVGGATFTWTRSKHNFRFGGETQASLLNPQNNLQTRGRWIYQNIGTTGQSGARGDEYADFLLTLPFTKTFGAADEVNTGGQLKMRSHVHGFFVNDDWKVTKDVTFTWGMRYEADFQAAAYNLNMLNFWPDRYRGIDGTMESTGLVQGGLNGVPNSTVNGDWNNFMPRIGIAWRIGDKWVVRSGAGLYFDLRTGQIAQQAFQNPPTYTEVTAVCSRNVMCAPNVPDNWTYLNPGHKSGLVPFPVSASEERSVRGIERKVKTDNAWQYNFSVQRELPGNMLIETAYVGTKGTHLMAQRNFNPLVPVDGGPLAAGARLGRLYPGFSDILITAQNGDSSYHSFQVTAKKRVARTNFQLAYTVAKTLSNGNEGSRFFTGLWPVPWNDWSRARGPANFDRPQRLSFVFNHDLPSHFQNAAGKFLLNDWSINGFLVTQSGVPLTVTNRDSGRGLGGSTASTTATNLFANVNAGVPLIHSQVNGRSTGENLNAYINPAAFTKAPAGTFGNSGRGMFRGPGQWNLDFSIFKDFGITERYKVQFRTEAFNLFNHANFGDPTTDMDSPNFGIIRGTTVNARLVQFALKFVF